MIFPRFSNSIFAITGTALWVLNAQMPASAASFRGLGDLPGSFFLSGGFAISTDGSAVAGTSLSTEGISGEAFRWTEDTGIVGLGDLPGGDFVSAAFGISADGSVVVGASFSGASAASNPPPTEAFRWTEATGMVGLGDLPGGEFSSFSFDVSADGTVVVGDSDTDVGRQAFRWTAETGIVGLGDLPEGDSVSVATAASTDGSVLVGSGSSASGTEAFRWTEETGIFGLGDLPGGMFLSRATDVSLDGSVVVGRSASASSSGNPITDTSGTEAFLWTEETGIFGLGDLPGGSFFSRAFGVSGDGSIVVGRSESAAGLESFIWDSTNGMRSLTEVLTKDFSLDLTGWTGLVAQDISDDGLSIVGFGTNPNGSSEAWIAQLDRQSVPEPTLLWGIFGLVGVFGVRSSRTDQSKL